MGQLCDSGCQAIFDANKVEIVCDNEVLLTGTRSEATNKLWTIDECEPPTPMLAAMHAVNQSAKPSDLVAFAHAAFFSPAIRTLKQALEMNEN